jgi:hypothetical protein
MNGAIFFVNLIRCDKFYQLLYVFSIHIHQLFSPNTLNLRCVFNMYLVEILAQIMSCIVTS